MKNSTWPPLCFREAPSIGAALSVVLHHGMAEGVVSQTIRRAPWRFRKLADYRPPRLLLLHRAGRGGQPFNNSLDGFGTSPFERMRALRFAPLPHQRSRARPGFAHGLGPGSTFFELAWCADGFPL